jgi:hypothetical protein
MSGILYTLLRRLQRTSQQWNFFAAGSPPQGSSVALAQWVLFSTSVYILTGWVLRHSVFYLLITARQNTTRTSCAS